MPKKIDLTGKKFTRLYVTERSRSSSKGRGIEWLCKCDCGNEIWARADRLKSGDLKSCSCLHKEINQGLSHTKAWNSWRAMKERCTNPKNNQYANYGGRGITYCPEWESFRQFYKDMGERPEGCSLERINNELGYGKDNCIWATREQQSINKRDNLLITYNDETKPLCVWVKELKLNYNFIYNRIRNGMPFHIAITRPKGRWT